MATYNLIGAKTFVAAGLNTFNYSLLASGAHNVKIVLTDNPASGIQVQVTQNATPIFTSTAFSATQGHFEIKVPINGSISDAISVIISSSSAIDKQLNTVKSTVTIQGGY